jgi:glycosyltransferase involved in cell wall biosynthesis
MKILQVTNIVSHHQLPLARELMQIVGENNFRFCATEIPDVERQRLGWDNRVEENWILRAAECDKDKVVFEEWWDNADIVICGERLFEKMHQRLIHGKLCFYMSERWWKPPIGLARLLHPRFLKMVMLFLRISKYPSFHYLPIGPYAAKDISILINMKNRMWRWGYFTDSISYDNSSSYKYNNNTIKIIWIGRMLHWKSVDTIITSIAELNKNRKLDLKLTLIGEGPERLRLERMANNLLKSDSYIFLDPVPASEVQRIMSQHDVYVLSSTAYEGWGAVINEAMSSGCVVVASKEAGAAAAIIKDGVNGLLFNSGDWRDLSQILLRLYENDELRHSIAKSGKFTIEESWSPRIVANRFSAVTEALLYNKDIPLYKNGPMSRM